MGRARWSLQRGVLGVILPATHSRRGLSNADDSIQRGSCQTRTPCDKCSATAGNMQPSARHAHLQGTNTHGAYHDDCPPKTIFTTRGCRAGATRTDRTCPWPVVLKQRWMLKSFLSCISMATGQMSASKKPPLWPHSRGTPFEVECSNRTCTLSSAAPCCVLRHGRRAVLK